MIKKLSPNAEAVIQKYLHLHFTDNLEINTPYLNNRRTGIRAGLRVLIGKGTPDEIIDEARLIALREKIELTNLDTKNLKKFLVDHGLGIDCSGLAYHILAAELRTHGTVLGARLKFPFIKNPLRKLIARLRPVESAGVRTLAHEKNATRISTNEIQPGDMIVMIETGTTNKFNHVLLVTETDSSTDNQISKITYIQSIQYSKDGKYNHGVRTDEISITKNSPDLRDETWSDESALEHARQAKELFIVRLKY